MDHTVTGIFDHVSAANDAVTALAGAGFAKDKVVQKPMSAEGVIALRRRQPKDVIVRQTMPPARAAGLGFVAGAVSGGGLGLLMGLGWLVIMGTGQAMYVGPFLATLIGFVVFGVFGALGGYIWDADLPTLDPEPPADESMLKATLVSVTTDSQNVAAAQAVMKQHKAREGVSVWKRDNGSLVPVVTA